MERTALLDAAARVAAALIVQDGELTEEELRALPMISSWADVDAVRHRLARDYSITVYQPGATGYGRVFRPTSDLAALRLQQHERRY